MANSRNQDGFTLIEVMMVVAIMGILAATATVTYSREQKKARRTEVTLALEKIRESQYAYKLEYGDYAGTFEDLVFATSQGGRVSSTVHQGGLYQYTLSQPWGLDSYYVTAVANIDGDAFLDVWVVEAGRFD